MTRTIAALTIALLIGACKEAQTESDQSSAPALSESRPESQRAAADSTRQAQEAEAQTGEWEIEERTDEWGDPDPDGEGSISQMAKATLITAGEENQTVYGMLVVNCNSNIAIGFIGSSPKVGKDREYLGNGLYRHSAPTKVDGTKGRMTFNTMSGGSAWIISDQNTSKITEAQESLEILFAWGRDGHQQSLTWSMDGLSEAFAEACGEELDAEEE